jgi:hypothetical protein
MRVSCVPIAEPITETLIEQSTQHGQRQNGFQLLVQVIVFFGRQNRAQSVEECFGDPRQTK